VEVRSAVESWRGPGVLVVVTHGSTIKALTGVDPREGKFIALPQSRQHFLSTALPPRPAAFSA
jgi:hypothetical protein